MYNITEIPFSFFFPLAPLPFEEPAKKSVTNRPDLLNGPSSIAQKLAS